MVGGFQLNAPLSSFNSDDALKTAQTFEKMELNSVAFYIYLVGPTSSKINASS